MLSYEINSATIAIIPIDDTTTKVIEDNNTYYVKRTSPKIIDDSCRYFGSSYLGRFEGSKQMLGGTIYKSPIIIEESREIIFFPTGSARCTSCAWVSLNKIEKYSRSDYDTLITFKNGQSILFPISYEIVENQILRSSRLESILRQRKNF